MTAERREAGHEGDQTFVGDCPHCAPSPVVDRDGLEEAGAAAWLAVKGPRYREVDTRLRSDLETALTAAAPVIVKAERARIREGIEKLRKSVMAARHEGEAWEFDVHNHALNAVLALLDEEARNG